MLFEDHNSDSDTENTGSQQDKERYGIGRKAGIPWHRTVLSEETGNYRRYGKSDRSSCHDLHDVVHIIIDDRRVRIQRMTYDGHIDIRHFNRLLELDDNVIQEFFIFLILTDRRRSVIQFLENCLFQKIRCSYQLDAEGAETRRLLRT